MTNIQPENRFDLADILSHPYITGENDIERPLPQASPFSIDNAISGFLDAGEDSGEKLIKRHVTLMETAGRYYLQQKDWEIALALYMYICYRWELFISIVTILSENSNSKYNQQLQDLKRQSKDKKMQYESEVSYIADIVKADFLIN